MTSKFDFINIHLDIAADITDVDNNFKKIENLALTGIHMPVISNKPPTNPIDGQMWFQPMSNMSIIDALKVR